MVYQEGATVLGTQALNSGIATWSTAALAVGVHSITATYSGDATDVNSRSLPVTETITPAVSPDFSLTISGAQTVAYGEAASYTVTVVSANGSLASPVVLTASGLPADATVIFTPSSLTPGTGASTSTLQIQTGVTVAASFRAQKPLLPWAPALLVFFASICISGGGSRRSKRRCFRSAAFLGLFCCAMLGSIGCGQAIKTTPPQPSSYTVTVTGTSGLLQHTATTTLTVTTNQE